MTNFLNYLNEFLRTAKNRHRNGWVKRQQLEKLHETMNHHPHQPEY